MTVSLIAFDIPLNWLYLPMSQIKDILYLSIGNTLVTSYLLQKASPNLTPAKVSAYIYLTPALVLIIECVYKLELPDKIILPGILLSVFYNAIFYRGMVIHA